MKNYTYVSVTGEKTEVEVTDEMFEILKSEDRAEHANDVKETRRHYHWEAMDYEGKDWMDIENRARITAPERWKAEMILMIPEAIEKLPKVTGTCGNITAPISDKFNIETDGCTYMDILPNTFFDDDHYFDQPDTYSEEQKDPTMLNKGSVLVLNKNLKKGEIRTDDSERVPGVSDKRNDPAQQA